MANDFNLLNELAPEARRTDPKTSHAAAKRIRPASRRHKILYAVSVKGMDGATAIEVSTALGVERDLVSSNFRPLQILGYLELAPFTRLNPKTQNAQQVWVITDKYRQSPLARATFKLHASKQCPHCGGAL